jgi:hypothetical protein
MENWALVEAIGNIGYLEVMLKDNRLSELKIPARNLKFSIKVIRH